MSPAETKLRYARSRVVHGYPFFGALLLRQQCVETTDVETMATDGDHLYFNPSYVEQCTQEELFAVIAHEALHPALCHHTRRGDRRPDLWNKAADYAINPLLVAAGFHLPEGVLIRDDLTLLGYAERIYAKLLAEEPPPPPPEPESDDSDENDDGDGQGDGSDDDQGEGDDDTPQDGDGSGDDTGAQEGPPQGKPTTPSYGGMGAVLDAPVKDDVERAAEDAKWRVALTQAAMSAGDLPAAIQAQIEATIKPRDDWRVLTARYVSQLVNEDSTWRSPNRRFVANGIYLPSMRSEKLAPALLVIDTSGSMPSALIEDAIGNVPAILEDCGIDRLDVVTHDTAPGPVQPFEPGDVVTVGVSGRGGTHFAPICDLIDRADEPYSVVIWFTDLEPADWDRCREPQSPVLWVDYTDGKQVPPFGDDVVRMQS